MFKSDGDLVCPVCGCLAGNIDAASPGDARPPYPGRASRWYIVPECGHGEYELRRDERFTPTASDLEYFVWYTDEGTL